MSNEKYNSNQLKLVILEVGLKNPQYDIWNIASLNNAIDAIRGKYGPKGHELGIQLCEGFLNWYIRKSSGLWKYLYSYVSNTENDNDNDTIFLQPSEIRKMIEDANAEYIETYLTPKTPDSEIIN